MEAATTKQKDISNYLNAGICPNCKEHLIVTYHGQYKQFTKYQCECGFVGGDYIPNSYEIDFNNLHKLTPNKAPFL